MWLYGGNRTVLKFFFVVVVKCGFEIHSLKSKLLVQVQVWLSMLFMSPFLMTCLSHISVNLLVRNVEYLFHELFLGIFCHTVCLPDLPSTVFMCI
jgi:hypothetical protein